MKIRLAGGLAAVLLTVSSIAVAQESRSYTQGPVTEVSYIKIKPGMFDAYMKWLATERKQLMDEYKKAGLILDSRVYGAQARGPKDADIILTVTYRNWAAFDGLEDKQEAVSSRIVGTRAQANERAISRESMREVLGSETIQELVLK
jgi:hypothetical protein